MAKRLERSLEGKHGVAIGGVRGRLRASLTEVDDSLIPYLAQESVVSQLLHVFHLASGIQRFDRPQDSVVKGPPPIVEQTAVGYLANQRVLECVLEIREESSLIGELAGLEPGETEVKRLL